MVFKIGVLLQDLSLIIKFEFNWILISEMLVFRFCECLKWGNVLF